MIRRHQFSRSSQNKGIYARLALLLERYVSRILAQSLLGRALSVRGIEGSTLDARGLEVIFDHLMVGLRLFCEAERLPEATALVTEFCLAHGAFVSPRARPSSPNWTVARS